MRRVKPGERLPSVKLAVARGDFLETVDLEPRLNGRRVILVGLPGAFTPVCTGRHIPELVSLAPSLKQSGFEEIICVAPNSPWVVEAWASRMDPEGRLTFLSDGNLELTRAAGLTARAHDLFLGECSARYSMILHHAVIERLAVEDQLEQVTCTGPRNFVG